MTFQKVYDHTVAKCPRLVMKNTYPIHEWLVLGYDTDKDIIPAIDEASKGREMTIHSFGFFTGFIRKRHTKRITTPVEISLEERERQRAANIRWHKERGLTTTKVGQQDFDWLEQYEKREVTT